MANIPATTRIQKRSHKFAREVVFSLLRNCEMAIASTPEKPNITYVALSPSHLPDPPNPHKTAINKSIIAKPIRANPLRVRILGKFKINTKLLQATLFSGFSHLSPQERTPCLPGLPRRSGPWLSPRAWERVSCAPSSSPPGSSGAVPRGPSGPPSP